MAIRDDISIDWSISPRIITIASPSTELVLQDLADTIWEAEDKTPNLGYPHMFNGSGKEALGGGVYVGITMTLLDAKVKFEDRPPSTFVQCNVLGGNLVALSSGDSEMSPIETSDYTQVVRTSSSSATLQELETLQYSSYQNAVWIDTSTSYSGTEFPNGTREFPVNNTQDAVLIAREKGFDTLGLIGNLTLDAGDTIENLIIMGQNSTLSNLTINPASNTLNSEFHDCSITGILDGNSTIQRCNVHNLEYINGFIRDSVLTGIITLGGNESANILNCYAGFDTTNTPIIDMGDSGQDLGLRAYSGSITLRNKHGTDKVFLDIISGEVIIESTVTNGEIYVRGDLRLEDNSTGNAVVDMSAVQLLEAAYNGKVFIDTFTGDSGALSYPYGTVVKPMNNLNDAIAIADSYGFFQYSFKGAVTSTQNFTRNKFSGTGAMLNDIITMDGHTFTDCLFELATITGNGTLISCQFDDGIVKNFTGAVNLVTKGCGLFGTITLTGSSQFLSKDVSFGSNPTIIDLGDTIATVKMLARAGNVKFINAGSASMLNLTLDEVDVELDSSCTGGVAMLEGTGTLVNNSTMSVNSTLKSLTTISSSVWDETLTGTTHSIPTSAGRRLREMASSVILTGTAIGNGNGYNQIELNGDASDVDAAYDPAVISIVGGIGLGQTRGIYEYQGSTKTATVDRNWKVQPDASSEYIINAWPGREDVNDGLATEGDSNSITLNQFASPFNDAYKHQTVFLRSGMGEDQVRAIISYNGSTKKAMIEYNWNVIPDTTSAYVIIPAHNYEPIDVATTVWNYVNGDTSTYTMLSNTWNLAGGNRLINNNREFFYNSDGDTMAVFVLLNETGDSTMTNVYQRVKES